MVCLLIYFQNEFLTTALSCNLFNQPLIVLITKSLKVETQKQLNRIKISNRDSSHVGTKFENDEVGKSKAVNACFS
jgi:hypothetical protein